MAAMVAVLWGLGRIWLDRFLKCQRGEVGLDKGGDGGVAGTALLRHVMSNHASFL